MPDSDAATYEQTLSGLPYGDSAVRKTIMSQTISFRRVGVISNAHLSAAFEDSALACFAALGVPLQRCHRISLGASALKKQHAFDLGCGRQKIIVECKSHRWTVGTNVPSPKLTVWNESVYYFQLAPREYRKIMFVLKDFCPRRDITLATYYLNTYLHLIPDDVEFWEFDQNQLVATRLR
jgi:hypothetical protein